jgi:chromosome partitioning protein
MYTLSIISQKGGTGKTTLALNLASAMEADGRTAVIIDLDPQASAKSWHDGREDESPVVISAQAARIPEVLKTAQEHGADFVIIDTAPHSENASLTAARASDLVLVPTRPAILDLRAIAASADICALAKVRAFAVLNAAPPRGSLPDEAGQAINSYGLEVCPVRIHQRMAFVHSLTAGQTAIEFEPKGKAAKEINDFYKWTCSNVGM